jgi:hypothetical protein
MEISTPQIRELVTLTSSHGAGDIVSARIKLAVLYARACAYDAQANFQERLAQPQQKRAL